MRARRLGRSNFWNSAVSTADFQKRLLIQSDHNWAKLLIIIIFNKIVLTLESVPGVRPAFANQRNANSQAERTTFRYSTYRGREVQRIPAAPYTDTMFT